ncbi:hypothetical protein ACFLSQ_04955 [Bacteroidota bacterium]
MLKIILLFLFSIIIYSNTEARKCYDYMLLDGGENLVTYGMDTTQHWWAVTQPFEESYRLIIDGQKSDVYKEIKQLTFSADGKRWACFVKNNVEWFLMTNDTLISIHGNEIGEIEFSPNSRHIVYSFYEANDEIIVYKGKRIRTYLRTGRILLSNNAERIAWVSNRSNGFVLNISGKETEVYDNIIPIGFWYNAEMLWAAKNGDVWEIYKGSESISDVYLNISEAAINLGGNVAAALATEQSGKHVGILISDEYYEPLVGSLYDQTYNLILHPSLPLLAYNAENIGQKLVILNTAEYYGGKESTGAPVFTHDGEDLYFLGCDIHCFVNINGRKYTLNSEIPINRFYAKKPGSNTIAYSTNSSMVVKDIETNGMYAGMMVDELISPRYNWRNSTYETLGSIGNRLYLMTCKY